MYGAPKGGVVLCRVQGSGIRVQGVGIRGYGVGLAAFLGAQPALKPRS